MLKSKKFAFDVLDGSDMGMKERRNELFSISGSRGQYPQFFLVDNQGGAPTYVGNWEDVEGINDNSGLPEEILEANPGIVTWEKVWNGVAV